MKTGLYQLKRSRIAYKAALTISSDHGRHRRYVVIKLRIPKGTWVNITNNQYNRHKRKCRAATAEVLDIRYRKGQQGKKLTSAISMYDTNFYYSLRGIVTPTLPFDFNEGICTSGIHFFFNREDALKFKL